MRISVSNERNSRTVCVANSVMRLFLNKTKFFVRPCKHLMIGCSHDNMRYT